VLPLIGRQWHKKAHIYAGLWMLLDSVDTRTGRERRYRPLVPDARLSWPDALSFGPDGMLYVAVNKQHKTTRLNAGRDGARPPQTTCCG